jgi:hypothetical protein
MREFEFIELTDEDLIAVAGGRGWELDPNGLSATSDSPGGAGWEIDPNG